MMPFLFIFVIIIYYLIYLNSKPKFKIGDKIIYQNDIKEFKKNRPEYEVIKIGENKYLLLNLINNSERNMDDYNITEKSKSFIDSLYCLYEE